jgi:hypothetical protein
MTLKQAEALNKRFNRIGWRNLNATERSLWNQAANVILQDVRDSRRCVNGHRVESGGYCPTCNSY